MGQRRWRRWRWCSQSVGVGRYSRPPCKPSFLRVPPLSLFLPSFSTNLLPSLSSPILLPSALHTGESPSCQASFVLLRLLSSLTVQNVPSSTKSNPKQGYSTNVSVLAHHFVFSPYSRCSYVGNGRKNVQLRLARLTIRGLGRLAG